MEELRRFAFDYLPKILGGAAVIVLFWAVAVAAKAAFEKFSSSDLKAKQVVSLISSLVYYAIIVVGILTGLNTMGVEMGPVLASLGLGGFALGFALKDFIGNCLAGALILIYRPFKDGDLVIVAGCEGRVLETNMRYTVLEGKDRVYMIPNSVIFSNPLQLKTSD